MLKKIVKLDVVVNDRQYQFLCDEDSPIDHIKEVLFQLQKYIGQIEDDSKNQMAANKSADPAVPESPKEEIINE